MFSMTTEYALRAAVFLGEFEGRIQTSQRVAEGTRTPVRYAARVLQLLVEAGLATSRRGPSGGFTLARPPRDITLLEVIRAIEPFERAKDKTTEPAGDLVPLHKVLEAVAADAERTLGSCTLANVLEGQLAPLGLRR